MISVGGQAIPIFRTPQAPDWLDQNPADHKTTAGKTVVPNDKPCMEEDGSPESRFSLVWLVVHHTTVVGLLLDRTEFVLIQDELKAAWATNLRIAPLSTALPSRLNHESIW